MKKIQLNKPKLQLIKQKVANLTSFETPLGADELGRVAHQGAGLPNAYDSGSPRECMTESCRACQPITV
jgi:hypothetical protein